jgi:retron-type reverse transcriptase
LRDRKFIPEPASLIFIAKPNHPEERRPITLIRPDDRIVLTCLNRLLTPLFERQFLPHSYAYRPGRGAWTAIERVTKYLRQGLARTASGFLHKPQKGKAGLLYDFIEEFRAAAVDRCVLSWLNLGVER